jgi:Tfp pilus assembly protein PilZ
MPSRPLLVVGSLREESTQRVQEAAAAAGVVAQFQARIDEAKAAITAADPLAVAVRMDAPGADALCAFVRTQPRLADVPVFGVTSERTDIAFTEIFSWGGDDLVSLWSPQPLTRRLRPLTARKPRVVDSSAEGQGCAVIAGADPRWRSVMGRALYAGGFSVRFVASADDLQTDSMGPAVRLVVASDDVALDGGAACAVRARAAGSTAAWVVVVPPKRMAASTAAVSSLSRIAIADGYAPPENVLFLANELLARRGQDQRASARLLYGTRVAFRMAGRDEDEIGFSYNISAGGVYVRSLAPLDQGSDVWVEMWVPRSERRVRLGGTVAWKRPFGSGERATVPAGFGVKIECGLGGDLDRWKAGYDAFAEDLLGRRSRAPSAPEM